LDEDDDEKQDDSEKHDSDVTPADSANFYPHSMNLTGLGLESKSLSQSQLLYTSSLETMQYTPQLVTMEEYAQMYDNSMSSLPSTEIFGINFAAPIGFPAFPNPNFPIHPNGLIIAPAGDSKRTAGQPTNVVPNPRMDRKTLKRLRNRVSASRCRNKKKQWVQDLEERHDILKAQKDQLITRLNILKDAVLYSRMVFKQECQ
jgi:hypothetical protein